MAAPLSPAPASAPALEVGRHRVGGGAPCFVIAEAGVNHNGDPDLAHRLVDVAADAGADAVKFQTFSADRLASAAAPKAAYQETAQAESQRDMLRRLELSEEAHVALQRHCAARGILFLSTPFDEPSADFLDSLGLPAFKMPSGELTNLPFLRHVAAKGRPMLVSTGMATEAEVAEAVDALRAGGAGGLALFHCVSRYPARPEECNLRAMATLETRFAVPVGWSDHTPGDAIALAAVARGAALLEKHFTLDRAMEGPDHAQSLEPGELAALVAAVRAVEAALGDGVKRPVPAEAEIAAVARKSLVAARDLAAGTRLARADLLIQRPGTGLSPARLDDALGRPLRQAVAAGAVLTVEMLGEAGDDGDN